MNANEEISRFKGEYIPSERVLKRALYENEARKLLSNILDLSREDFDNLISLIDLDYWENEKVGGRFHPLFSKPNRNKIESF